MISERMNRVLALLEKNGWAKGVDDAVRAAAEALEFTGLAVSLSVELTGLEPVACSGTTARRFDDLQFTLGEGPASDALRSGAEISVTDISKERADRWPLLLREVVGLRVRAVFCFPMAIGAIRIGVLSATRSSPGRLTGQHRSDALALAASLTTWYLSGTEKDPEGVRDGTDAPEFQGLQHSVIHQATGMLSVQLNLSLADALVRLRAHSYGKNRPILNVAQDIVSRRLRLPPLDGNTSPPAPDKD
ncbi:GAF and ANTAR domain-containing protein [Streptomyces sp. N35]|uniref:GAF and ANTAR domain-containing protein n=1 Tax=Streptomyces sp. N35 TaxID=2795730 RepID=UPI0018F28767|nr:GAF and ANTAR domain-containing protein [Streptomyces sp. N35]